MPTKRLKLDQKKLFKRVLLKAGGVLVALSAYLSLSYSLVLPYRYRQDNWDPRRVPTPNEMSLRGERGCDREAIACLVASVRGQADSIHLVADIDLHTR